jgi:hypothetical protein
MTIGRNPVIDNGSLMLKALAAVYRIKSTPVHENGSRHRPGKPEVFMDRHLNIGNIIVLGR